LWGSEVAPLSVGPLVEADTIGPIDVDQLAGARSVRASRMMHRPSRVVDRLNSQACECVAGGNERGR
jgi:hypothetical protein